MTKTNKIVSAVFLAVFLFGTAPSGEAGIFDLFRGKPRPGPSVAAAAEAGAPVGEDAFSRGYELFSRKDYRAAIPHLYRYLQNHSFDDEDYEWALFFFGLSLHETGLSHAAVDTLSHLVTKKPNAKIVSYSLELLERIARTRPFDREEVVLNVLSGQELGFVDDELQNFINYYQGIYDWEHGYTEWGSEHLERIRPGSHYYYKYLFQKALRRIYADRLDEAEALLSEILGADSAPPEEKDEARVTLARILFEQDRFEEAFLVYQDLEKPNVEQAKYLMERAWAQYRLGRPEKAMGLLYAFEAPGFWRHFTPEFFILKSFIYKDVCHYNRAMNVVEDFHERYGDALDFIYGRGDVAENSELLTVMMEKRTVKTLYRFLRLLERERTAAGALEDPELRQHLEKIYALQTEETSRRLQEHVEREYESLAESLLRYEEEAHLLEYEIGLDMYQRVSDYHYRDQGQSVGGEEKVVAFAFQGEFWNDELDDFEVVLENRCDSLEEWDIFFK
ncbi:MAG: hypothetical protein C0617_11520 [Desulfuromonas sp.]|uniref:tetratricopeptide repeat protein n=1 Tax=Desulfuromonas sp. TaxID=892 RepID=UPI000CCB4C96|nr:hypothetical protein [Desulfuromonas sp.]PLX83162.1 MAG: hypothetical protein C0617_11520 [Desulfuromonas sp.]